MQVVWILEWEGITPEVYADICQRTEWETDPPKGLQHQVTAFSDKGLVLTQVWLTPDHVMVFMERRLLPVIRELNIRSMPRVDQYPVHGILAPQ